jgi:hypothetical protein
MESRLAGKGRSTRRSSVCSGALLRPTSSSMWGSGVGSGGRPDWEVTTGVTFSFPLVSRERTIAH